MRQNFIGKENSDALYAKGNQPQGILHARFNYNTTRLTLTDLHGNTILWTTPSRCGFKGTVRRTVFASKASITEMGKQMAELGFVRVHGRLKGITRAGRRQLWRLLKAEGVNFCSIEDVTPVPFNGTRLRRKRRR